MSPSIFVIEGVDLDCLAVPCDIVDAHLDVDWQHLRCFSEFHRAGDWLIIRPLCTAF